MRYQLFLPDTHKPEAKELQKFDKWMSTVGLQDHVAGIDHTSISGFGPDNLTGQLCGWLNSRTGAIRLEHKPAEQTWLPALPVNGTVAGSYWVGVWNEDLPTPQELIRTETQPGKWTQLGDTEWKLPTPTTVEREGQYREDGTMYWVPMRDFAWICDEAERYAKDLLETWQEKQMVISVDPSEFVGWILRLLRVNYHITPEIAAHLGLWRSSQLKDAVLSSLGWEVSDG